MGPERSEHEHGGRGRLGSTLSGLAVAVGSLLFLGGFGWGAVIYQPYTIPTESMHPTLSAGDRVLAQRVDGDQVRRGDVVVFRDPSWGGGPMVKRVVGVGGDRIACCGGGGRLTVNDKPVDEPYLAGDPSEPGSVPPAFTVTVPEGRLFLLGDNRLGSLDSRSHLSDPQRGSVSRSAVTGRLDAVVWPVDGGVVERPEGFAGLPGGISSPGPVVPLAAAAAAGAILIVGGAGYGPIARGAARRAARGSARGSARESAGRPASHV
ncbi:signal peptidase I [Streptomyces inusitatus]|uniref:Signal peptidase I n=1 Tax=Streptomyces inusitatus TaxID=68221 RepID=A0A918UZR3_9ACTN|nr:signal peptidase I [Streptomyces inusitatus]GGZ47396.1 signal peptidase I [Streptomyces inusitatus]